MKKLLLIFAFVAAASGIYLLWPEPRFSAASDIDRIQSEHLRDEGKYRQYKRGELDENTIVDVYTTPRGGRGYIVRHVDGTTVTITEKAPKGENCTYKGCSATYQSKETGSFIPL